MTNDNPTLIAGFEDVMAHIRNQEKRIKELEMKNSVLEGTMKRYSDANMDLKKENNRLNNEIIWEWNEKLIALKATIQEFEEKNEDIHKRYQKKIDTLISQKQELEAKVDEAQVIFKENLKYKKEIDTLKETVENECEASGIMEVMNMRIEDAEKQVEEYKLKYEEQRNKAERTRKRANEQTQTVITQATVIKNLLTTIIANDKSGNLWDDGIKLRTDWTLYDAGDTYHDTLEEEIDEMNHDDWNEDDNRSKIIYEGGCIRVEINDTSSEEESDEDA